jgi:solute carrier family 7 (L-type amino acid transporter), member 6
MDLCLSGYALQIGFVAGDMKDPVRDLPRVINTAMVVVIVGFVLMNIALYIAVPIQHMRETSTPAMVGALHFRQSFTMSTESPAT